MHVFSLRLPHHLEGKTLDFHRKLSSNTKNFVKTANFMQCENMSPNYFQTNPANSLHNTVNESKYPEYLTQEQTRIVAPSYQV